MIWMIWVLTAAVCLSIYIIEDEVANLRKRVQKLERAETQEPASPQTRKE